VLACKDVKHPSKAELEKIENHAKKYYWLNNNYAHTFELNVGYFLQEARQISKVSAKKTILALNKKTKATQGLRVKLLKKLKLDSYTKNLLDIVQTFAYMQDERKKVMLMAVGMQSLFLKEISKRLGISEEEGRFLTWEEFPELLKLPKVKLRRLIVDRKSFTLMVAHCKYGPMIFEGKQAKVLHRKIFEKTKSFVTELKGMSACRGAARGKVVVIKTRKDFGKMQKGCVLVATMTRPEFVPLMQKASAIITDEGGITSHAAIVSRELGIPCVIGTKVATKVFKDGDMVEVDANNGILKKL
jgi:phosphohistidine swiveling domain-containing protein